jgi:hypothetical protein
MGLNDVGGHGSLTRLPSVVVCLAVSKMAAAGQVAATVGAGAELRSGGRGGSGDDSLRW